MSVYIPGMEMPTSCFQCEFRMKIDPDNLMCIISQKAFEDRFYLIEHRDRSCPLIHVPDHGRWIPVTERLPEPTSAREWYLVALESGCVKTLAFEKSGRSDNLFKDGWHETASPVTHWMPLPEPPKEKEIS